MKKIWIVLVLALYAMTVYSQIKEVDAEIKSEINDLGFIIGKWSGSGWMMGRDGKRNEFEQTENVQYKLDSTIILIEGTGISSGKIIHNALAILSFNADSNAFNFHSYLTNGINSNFKAELIDGKLYWYPRSNIRYIIYLNENKQWYEKGEMNRGDNWFQFFEMTLNKIDE